MYLSEENAFNLLKSIFVKIGGQEICQCRQPPCYVFNRVLLGVSVKKNDAYSWNCQTTGRLTTPLKSLILESQLRNNNEYLEEIWWSLICHCGAFSAQENWNSKIFTFLMNESLRI